jgi:hypothetical protein
MPRLAHRAIYVALIALCSAYPSLSESSSNSGLNISTAIIAYGALNMASTSSQTPRMPQMPSFGNIRTFYPNTTLGLYHFRDGKLWLEKRIPAKLEAGEEQLQDTGITLMEPNTPRVDVALAFDFPEPLS